MSSQKQPFGGNLRSKFKFWTPIMSFVGNLRLSGRSLSKICSVCRKKIATSCPAFLAHDAHDAFRYEIRSIMSTRHCSTAVTMDKLVSLPDGWPPSDAVWPHIHSLWPPTDTTKSALEAFASLHDTTASAFQSLWPPTDTAPSWTLQSLWPLCDTTASPSESADLESPSSITPTPGECVILSLDDVDVCCCESAWLVGGPAEPPSECDGLALWPTRSSDDGMLE